MKLFYMTLLSLFLFSNQVQANTDVQVSIHSSNVGNIYYQVFGNDQPIYDELEFDLIHESGKIYKISTNDSILFLKNMPFGNYELKLKDKPFTYQFTIDKQYVKSQHILKRIDIYYDHSTPNTSDESNIGFYLSLLGVTSLLMLLIFYK